MPRTTKLSPQSHIIIMSTMRFPTTLISPRPRFPFISNLPPTTPIPRPIFLRFFLNNKSYLFLINLRDFPRIPCISTMGYLTFQTIYLISLFINLSIDHVMGYFMLHFFFEILDHFIFLIV